jgi:hypothetical protein
MPLPLVAFFIIGAVFGLLSYANRHHFSEGSTRPGPDRGLLGRVGWAALCTPLWPLMLLTGAFGLLRRQAAKKR